MVSSGKMVFSLEPLHVSAGARAVSQEGSTDWPDDDDPGNSHPSTWPRRVNVTKWLAAHLSRTSRKQPFGRCVAGSAGNWRENVQSSCLRRWHLDDDVSRARGRLTFLWMCQVLCVAAQF